MDNASPNQQAADTPEPSTPTAAEVMLAHQFVVNDTSVGGLVEGPTTPDTHKAFMGPVFAACACGRWERQCGTVRGAETKRGEHVEHVVEVLGEVLGDVAEPAAQTPVAAGACKMYHEEPYDFACCETHDTTFALGEECKFNGREMWEVFAEEADDQRGLKVRAEMAADEARLDLDVLRASIRQVIDEHPVSSAAFAEKVRGLLDPETDILREAQRAAWRFGHTAGGRGLGTDANPF